MDTSAGGSLLATDYWQHPEGAAGGHPWLKAQPLRWHLVLPETPVCSWPDHPCHRATMFPVVDTAEPGGWAWLLLIRMSQTGSQTEAVRARISPRAILGDVLPLPHPDFRKRVHLAVYQSSKGCMEVPPGASRWEKLPQQHQHALSCWLDVLRPKKDHRGRWQLQGRLWPWR